MAAMIIRTPDYHLRVFVSSTLKELADERKAVRQSILKLRLSPVMFESGARPHPAKELYQSYLSQSHIFIGIYWQSYGWVAPDMNISGLEDEYNLSAKLPRLIYIKTPAPAREPALVSLLDRIRNDNTSSYTYFSSPTELKELVQNDLALMLTERFEARQPNEISPLQIKVHPPTNLPVPRNPLVGREKELTTVCELLKQENVALITLTGAGGTGKSRLAIQIGLNVLDHFTDGVYLVRLEPINDPELVISVIAETFGIRDTPESQPIEALLSEYLREKSMLLILDNFEQVVEAAPHVAEILEQCPRLKCIATSRSPLRLRAERELTVLPLEIPVASDTTEITALSQYAAVELFIQRAQAVNPDFAVTKANAQAIAEICYRLDGLPLAIELAAARIKLLPPQTLLARLDHRFEILTSGTRDLPERHRTLRSAIDWSYNLLNETDKTLFRRLAVFTDGWSFDAIQKVCDINNDLIPQVDDRLSSLVDNNLVIQIQGVDDEPRFGMLNTIRAYAAEQLDTCDEYLIIHQKFAQYFLEFVSEVEPRIRSKEREWWQGKMQREFGNIRSALDWISTTGNCIEIGQEIVIKVGLFWHICGYITEGQYWCDRMLTLCNESTPDRIRAGLLLFGGLLTRAQSDQAAATASVDKSLELLSKLQDEPLMGIALMARGIIASAMRDLSRAADSFEEAVGIFRRISDLWNLAISLSWLGDIALFQNETALAKQYHNESIKIARQQGDPWCLMPALMSSAQVEMMNGELETAYRKLVEVIQVLQKTGDRWSLSWTLIDLGHVVYLQGNIQQAGEYILEALQLGKTFGNLRALIIGLVKAAALIARMSQPDNKIQLALAARICGTCATYSNQPGLFIWINTKQLYEGAISDTKSLMNDDLWISGYSEGQNMPLENTIRLTMETLREIIR
jgi:predicted ATPase